MKFCVYRILGADDELLYVGMTRSLQARIGQHRVKKEWWPQAICYSTTYFGTKEDAEVAERTAIRTENPRFNQRWNGAEPSARPTLRRLRERALLSQDEVSELLGLSARAYAHWEVGRCNPRPLHIPRLAEVFGVSISEVAGCLGAHGPART